MDQDDYHFKLKIVVLGDKSVGKTSFLDSIINKFGKVIQSEQSEELNIRNVGFMDDNTLYKIQYWEIPGHLKNSNYFFRYCLNTTAAVYMFDASKRSSFENIEEWISSNEKCEINLQILVGNKVDLQSTKNTVSKSEAIGLAKKYGMEYFETCSIGDQSVAPVFDYVFSTIVNSIPNPPGPSSLQGKGIILGKRLLNSQKFQLALCDMATLYD